jgi:hypothetical protein
MTSSVAGGISAATMGEVPATLSAQGVKLAGPLGCTEVERTYSALADYVTR